MISWNIIGALIIAFLGGAMFGVAIYVDFHDYEEGDNDCR